MTTQTEIRTFPIELRSVLYANGFEVFSTSNPYGSISSENRRIWKVEEIGINHGFLTAGNVLKLGEGIGPRFATVKTGRPGWNVRQSFPKDSVRRGIGFIIATKNGDSVTLWKITPSSAWRGVR